MLTEEQFLRECKRRNVSPFKSNVGSLSKPMFTNGFTFNTPAGGTAQFPIDLSGNVSEMLGIVVLDAFTNDIGSLMINNDIVLQETSLAAFNPLTNIFKDAQYYKLPRRLTGKDNVVLTVTSSISHQIFPIFYLLPAK